MPPRQLQFAVTGQAEFVICDYTIELVFKSWKSYHGLTQVRGKRPERIECFIYGRLIMMVIVAFLSGSIRRYLWNTKKREISFLKYAEHSSV